MPRGILRGEASEPAGCPGCGERSHVGTRCLDPELRRWRRRALAAEAELERLRGPR
jgi:hypothetical protein